MTTTNLGLTKPTVGADSDLWGGELNTDLDLIDAEYARTTRGDAAYVVLSTDRHIAITAALTAARTFTLPAATALKTGQAIVIIDEAGGITSTRTLTVAPNGADTINGASSVVAREAYSVIVLRSDGTSKWTASLLSPNQSGTWTPTITFETPGTLSVSYSTQAGRWRRRGDMMYLDFDVAFTPTLGTASGRIRIGGLPTTFTGAGTGPAGTIWFLSTSITYPSGGTSLALSLVSSSALSIFALGSGVGANGLAVGNFTSGGAVEMSGSIWLTL